ncbi:helix-turn-helix domain-containing protein [Paludibacterium denitrificans]|uniref:helix-turn-helix domain-containing protein n=1 Tax=Paludibacterium denitrificans TaxID=2675226 RepID=UPI001E5C6953|nr:helix-turn-helix transcriptional regulator [Paludibacterium denitrificans]
MIQSMTQIKHDCVFEGKDIDTHVIELADTIVFMKTYGDRVRERREELGLTQAGLAKAIGAKHASTIGNIENRSGESRFTLELSKVLGVNPEWLKTGEGQKEVIDLGLPVNTPMRPVVLLDAEDEAGDAVISVPRYTLKASAGHGTPILEVDTKGDPNYCRTALGEASRLQERKPVQYCCVGRFYGADHTERGKPDCSPATGDSEWEGPRYLPGQRMLRETAL